MNLNRKIWTNEEKDFTCIEILEEDNLIVNNTFEIDENCYNIDYNLKNYNEKGVISVGFAKTNELKFPQGILYASKIEQTHFLHDCNTEEGFSGGPIILIYNLRIIGIHKGYSQPHNKNAGIYLKEIVLNLKEENEIKRNNIKEENNNSQLIDENIDMKLYSKQIYTFGMDTMRNIIKMKILIIGMRGLGVKVAKNIILVGPKEVQIYDPEITKINDLGSNFYLKEIDVGDKRRDEASKFQLSQLNPYVNVSIMKGSIFENIINFNVIVITEIMKKEILIKINEICRKNEIAFIYSGIFGLSGFIFDDFGEDHIITNDNAKEKKTFLIRKIENGIVYIENQYHSEGHSLSDGDYVIFREVGLTQWNDGKPRKIKVISKIAFKIDEKGNSAQNSGVAEGGYIEVVKMLKSQYHHSLKENLNCLAISFESIDTNKPGHMGVMNYYIFLFFLFTNFMISIIICQI